STGLEQDKIFNVIYEVGDAAAKKSVVIHADTKKARMESVGQLVVAKVIDLVPRKAELYHRF
ncbi:MAG: hypothetical protein ABFS18_14615, partial [Thermodesulfobacteriota bacterium]